MKETLRVTKPLPEKQVEVIDSLSDTEKKKNRLRVMVNTNAPFCPSGYGQQARMFMPKMVKEGYPTACIAFYGLEGGILNLDGMWMYPKIGSQWGEDAMLYHSNHFKADVIFTLQDIWTLDPNALRQLAKEGKRWIPILPVDHEPIPPAILDRCRMAYRVVSYSPFGHEELLRHGYHSTYIPHTVDMNAYQKRDRSEARKRLGIAEDVFLFGMVAANKDNPPRKSFQEVMDSFKLFHDKHPKSALYLHTFTRQAGGFPIDDYAKVLGIQDVVYHGDFYDMMFNIQPEDMSYIYSCFDCLLAPSQNEGFGVPIVEALACEVPVITTDFTAMRHLVEDGVTGYKIKVAYKRFTPLLSYVAIPDVADLYEKMEKIYTDDRVKMGKAGRKFVEENFELEMVWQNHWIPFLRALEKEIYKD